MALAYLARRGRRAPWRRVAPPPPEPADREGVPAVPTDVDLDQIAKSIDEVGGMHVEDLGSGELSDDDSDPHVGHHETDRNDTPIADRGSAGPRGL